VVFADCEPPYPLPNSIKSNPLVTPLDGWYFKNLNDPSLPKERRKINWYLPNVNTFKVSDIKNIIFDVTLFNIASPPFITYYTKLKASGNASSWYCAKKTFIIWDQSQLSPYTNYHFYTHLEPDTLLPNRIKYALTLDTFSSVGTMADDDLILAIAVGSDSSAGQNNVEFLADKVKIVTATSTFSYNFSSSTTEINSLQAQIDVLRGQVDNLYNYLFNNSSSNGISR
jgi:hypothetical protein